MKRDREIEVNGKNKIKDALLSRSRCNVNFTPQCEEMMYFAHRGLIDTAGLPFELPRSKVTHGVDPSARIFI